MKIILYMASTINGLIANKNDAVDFVLDSSWKSYKAMLKQSGNIILGRRTYDIIMNQSPGELEGVNVVAVTNHHMELPKTHQMAHSPQEALGLLQNADQVMVGGGGTLNASFMAEHLIDELYLDIEPTALGQGIPLFTDKDFEQKLKLLGSKQLSDDEIQLHYQIIR